MAHFVLLRSKVSNLLTFKFHHKLTRTCMLYRRIEVWSKNSCKKANNRKVFQPISAKLWYIVERIAYEARDELYHKLWRLLAQKSWKAREDTFWLGADRLHELPVWHQYYICWGRCDSESTKQDVPAIIAYEQSYRSLLVRDGERRNFKQTRWKILGRLKVHGPKKAVQLQ